MEAPSGFGSVDQSQSTNFQHGHVSINLNLDLTNVSAAKSKERETGIGITVEKQFKTANPSSRHVSGLLNVDGENQNIIEWLNNGTQPEQFSSLLPLGIKNMNLEI